MKSNPYSALALSNRGFSLLEVMMAGGLSIFVGLLLCLLFFGTISSQTNADTRQSLLVFQQVVDGVLAKEANCTALLANQPLNIARIKDAKIANGTEGQPISLNLNTPNLGGLGLIQEGAAIPSFRFLTDKLRLLGAVQLPDPLGRTVAQQTEHYWSVRLVLKPQLMAGAKGTSVPTDLSPREITSFIVKTKNLAATTQIDSCYKREFSYRRRCAYVGKVYVPLGFGATPADSMGCVGFSGLR